MRKLLVMIGLLAVANLLLATPQATARQGQQRSRAENEVRKLEREWLNAYEQRDAAAMNRIVAEGFTITFTNGAVQTKPQLMDFIKAQHDAANPAPKFHTEDVQSRVYGDTVILTGRVITERQQDGKIIKDEERYTDTYVKIDGRWQVVASHLSNVAEKKQP